jgi:hypothetical protein
MESIMKVDSGKKRARGGQPGNKNALKHGFFTQEGKDIRRLMVKNNQQLAELIQRAMEDMV